LTSESAFLSKSASLPVKINPLSIIFSDGNISVKMAVIPNGELQTSFKGKWPLG
jgi:hypothetical protein